MTRALLSALVAATTVLGLAACGSDTESDALAPDTLTIYSAQHANLVDAWVAGFTESTGIKVQVRQGKDASMGNQIVAEGASSPADVFLTENSPAITVVEDAGLLAPVDATTVSQVGEQYRPSTGDWVGIAARSTVLIYNPSLIDESELPSSMMDLADSQYAGQWGAAPAGADFQAIVAGMIDAQGEDATLTWLEGLKTNAKVYQNNIATMKAVNAGEVPMGIMYHYYWYRDQALTQENSGNTKLHYFGGEDAGAFVSVSGGAVLASSAHATDAQKFLAYITSPEGQQVLVDSASMEYAVGVDVASDPALPPLDSLGAPAINLTDLDGRTVIDLMTSAGLL